MGCVLLPLLTAALLGTADPPPSDREAIAQGLTAGSRAERLEALGRAEKVGDLPEALVRPVLGFVRRELELTATVPDGVGDAPDDALPAGLVRGDEVALARLREKPADYVGREFVLCGRLHATARFRSQRPAPGLEFDFKFDFAPVGAPDERARVFVSMKTGAGLSGAVVRMAEPGRSGWLLVRLTCKLDRGRLAQERGNALEAIEATDWQYYEPDGSAWAPPALAGVKRAMAAVRTADRGAVAALVEAVASEDEGATPEVDDLLRGTAFLGLLSLSEAARADAVARLRAVRHRARAVRARRWAAEVCTTLEKTVAKGPPARGAGDPAARAATALRIAENLEKSGKTAAALKQYAEVSSRFPGTPQAAAAAEHVKMLKRKAAGD